MLLLPVTIIVILVVISIFLFFFIWFLTWYISRGKKQLDLNNTLPETVVGVINSKKSEVEVILGKKMFTKDKFSIEEFCENFGLLISEVQDFSVVRNEESELQFYRKNLIGQINLQIDSKKRIFLGVKKKTYSITLFSSIEGMTKFTITNFVKRQNNIVLDKDDHLEVDKFLAEYASKHNSKFLTVFSIEPIFGEFYSEMIDDRILLEIQSQFLSYLKKVMKNPNISFINLLRSKNYESFIFMPSDNYSQQQVENTIQQIENGMNKFHKNFEGNQFSLSINVGAATLETKQKLTTLEMLDLVSKAQFSVFKALNSSVQHYVFNEKTDTKFYTDNFGRLSFMILHKKFVDDLIISFLPIMSLSGEIYGWEPIISSEKSESNISLTNLLRMFLYSTYDENKYVDILVKVITRANESEIFSIKKPLFIPLVIGEENVFELMQKELVKKEIPFDLNNIAVSLIKSANFQHRKLLHSLHYFQKSNCKCGLAIEKIITSELLVTPIDFHHIVLSPWIGGNKIPNYRELIAIKQLTMTNQKTPLLFFGQLNTVNFNIIKSYGVSYYANLSMNLKPKEVLDLTPKEKKDIIEKLGSSKKTEVIASGIK